MQLGLIIVWSGTIIDIPLGWHLCDGTKGTVDLRDLFVVGAGDSYDPADTGGSASHTHNFTGDGHSHDFQEGTDITGGIRYELYTTTEPLIGTTDAEDNIPPYYALAYIQKILGI